MKQAILFSIVWILFLSCSKKQDDDKEAPVVAITSPTNNQVFTGGETIDIKGLVSDNQYIKMKHIVIKDQDTEVLHVHIIPASKTYAFNQPLTIQSGVRYNIQVIGEDPAGNSFTQEVNISGN